MATAFNALELAVALMLSLCTAYVVQQTILSPLKSIPGPFLARLSNFWQLFFVYYHGKQASVLRRLHDRYGPVVRVGPKHVILNNPSLIKTVYSLRGDYVKSERYPAAGSRSPDGRNVPIQFSEIDEEARARIWRPIAKYYSLTHLLSFESHIDHVIQMMECRLEQEFCHGNNAGKVCDMFKWLTFAAWEVVMVTNFSQMQGFLKEGKDIANLMADSVWAADTFLRLGNIPKVERFLRAISRKPIFDGALKFSLHQIAERRGLGNWKDASRLTYLDAVVQEALRFHPGASFIMERVVPDEGLILPDGGFIEPGTVVGMHQWVVNRDHGVFGRDADFFVPERWLQKDGEDTRTFSTRVSLMKNTLLSFGSGKRGCTGKNLALLEIYKIIGTLFASFDIELVDPSREPKIIHSVFVRMEGFKVTMKTRERNVMA
ncbi:MAG: hypothetical protein Q9166_001705 [cf. Caloplaca sp. 2 TL-2023]